MAVYDDNGQDLGGKMARLVVVAVCDRVGWTCLLKDGGCSSGQLVQPGERLRRDGEVEDRVVGLGPRAVAPGGGPGTKAVNPAPRRSSNCSSNASAIARRSD